MRKLALGAYFLMSLACSGLLADGAEQDLVLVALEVGQTSACPERDAAMEAVRETFVWAGSDQYGFWTEVTFETLVEEAAADGWISPADLRDIQGAVPNPAGGLTGVDRGAREALFDAFLIERGGTPPWAKN